MEGFSRRLNLCLLEITWQGTRAMTVALWSYALEAEIPLRTLLLGHSVI